MGFIVFTQESKKSIFVEFLKMEHTACTFNSTNKSAISWKLYWKTCKNHSPLQFYLIKLRARLCFECSIHNWVLLACNFYGNGWAGQRPVVIVVSISIRWLLQSQERRRCRRQHNANITSSAVNLDSFISAMFKDES